MKRENSRQTTSLIDLELFILWVTLIGDLLSAVASEIERSEERLKNTKNTNGLKAEDLGILGDWLNVIADILALILFQRIQQSEALISPAIEADI